MVDVIAALIALRAAGRSSVMVRTALSLVDLTNSVPAFFNVPRPDCIVIIVYPIKSSTACPSTMHRHRLAQLVRATFGLYTESK